MFRSFTYCFRFNLLASHFTSIAICNSILSAHWNVDFGTDTVGRVIVVFLTSSSVFQLHPAEKR